MRIAPLVSAELAATAGGPGARLDVLVAQVDDEAVGTVVVDWDAHARGRGTPMIRNLLVEPHARDRGIGSALVAAAERAVAARGCGRVGLEVGAVNSGARRLYDRLGYVATGAHGDHHTMTKDL